MNYQPLWVDGKTVGPDLRDSAARYGAIADHVRTAFPRGFSVLDLGAQSGYFSVRLQQEFDAQVTAVDGAPELASGLARMQDHRVRGLYRFLEPAEVLELRPVDVSLCLSVLHHVEDWYGMLESVLKISRSVFVECASHREEIGKDRELLKKQESAVSWLPGAVRVAETVGYDARQMRSMYLVPGRAAG